MISNTTINLDAIFTEYGNYTAIKTELNSFSYSDLRYILPEFCSLLSKKGIRQNQKVGLYLPNSIYHFLFLFASWANNFIFVPLNYKTPVHSLISGDNRIDHIFLEELELFDMGTFQDRCHSLKLFDNLIAGNKTALSKKQGLKIDKIDLNQETTIIYTSGSSGPPKGVVHTVGSYVYSALGTIESLGTGKHDKWVVSLPLYHVGGLSILVRTLLSGACSIFPKTVNDLKTTILTEKPAFLSLVPTQLRRFIKNPDLIIQLKDCKAILLGGAPAPKKLIDESILLKIPIIPTYGLTESCAQITGVRKNSSTEEFYTAGKPLKYRNMEIGKDNIITISGKTLFKYYIINNEKEFPFKNGRFKTGDLGRIDEKGNLVILGRRDEIFISGGENINPFEIEKCLREIESITEAIVVPAPHSDFGKVPVAFLESEDDPDINSIKMYIKQNLPSYMVPKKFYMLSSKNKTTDMKYSRSLLKKAVESPEDLHCI